MNKWNVQELGLGVNTLFRDKIPIGNSELLVFFTPHLSTWV